MAVPDITVDMHFTRGLKETNQCLYLLLIYFNFNRDYWCGQCQLSSLFAFHFVSIHSITSLQLAKQTKILLKDSCPVHDLKICVHVQKTLCLNVNGIFINKETKLQSLLNRLS